MLYASPMAIFFSYVFHCYHFCDGAAHGEKLKKLKKRFEVIVKTFSIDAFYFNVVITFVITIIIIITCTRSSLRRRVFYLYIRTSRGERKKSCGGKKRVWKLSHTHTPSVGRRFVKYVYDIIIYMMIKADVYCSRIWRQVSEALFTKYNIIHFLYINAVSKCLWLPIFWHSAAKILIIV